ncbi:MAG: hypothetical protein LUG16_01970 [Candidatus Gastranaerophilales bacterium]|nr:hypothetical protein [Candidatus Gastranaerophilales bacterium]
MNKMTKSVAIRDKETIEEIKSAYRRWSRTNELLLFSLAINAGISNLLELKVKDVRNKQELPFRKFKEKILRGKCGAIEYGCI